MKRLLVALICINLSLNLFSQTIPLLTPNNIESVVKAMTLEEKAQMCCGIGKFFRDDGRGIAGAAGGVAGMARYGFPLSYWADSPSGLRIKETRINSTLKYPTVDFPSSILLASSWDTEAAKLIGASIGDECKEYGVSGILAPAMNIIRFPLLGRTAEYFSEDPLLSGRLASAYVEGVQGVGVGASIKHFAANNQETARLDNDARISIRALREIYLRGFEIAVKESDPWTVMSAYNKINGVYASENKWLLEDVLRGEWGFKGIVLSDWDAGMDGEAQIWAGNDVVEPGYDVQYNAIIAAVKNGTLSVTDLDRNVKRILEYVVKTTAYKTYPISNKIDIAAHRAVARKIAAESMVLLKNEEALPMKSNAKVALYGNVAYSQGKREVSIERGLALQNYKIDKALDITYKLYLGMDTVVREAELTDGDMIYTSFFRKDPDIAEPDFSAEQLNTQASANDYALIVIGQGAGEGNDCKSKDFLLTESELKLMEEVCSTYHKLGKKVIVILDIAIPIESASWKEKPDAIICAWNCGQEKGNAMADVLSGAVNPSGKLTVSFPVKLSDSPAYENFPVDVNYWSLNGFRGKIDKKRLSQVEPVKNVHYTEYKEGIYVGYRYFDTKNIGVSYPFGFGLSYTTFAYGEPSVKKSDSIWTATVKITNTGKVAGREVVQLYVSAPKKVLDKPEKELKGFAKTSLLQPGESETVTICFSEYLLSSFNESTNMWVADKGIYKALFAASSKDVRQRAEFKLKKAFTENIHSKHLVFK